VLAPFLIVPHTGSPTIFFGTIVIAASIGAFIPLIFGRETVGQLETCILSKLNRTLTFCEVEIKKEL
jgi:hypothetical protein